MGLVPYVGMQVAPLLTEGMEIGLIDGKSFGIGLWNKLRLTRYWPYMLRIIRFAEAHVIVTSHGVAERLVIDIRGNVKVHAATHILNNQAITTRGRSFEIDVPDIGAYKILLACLQTGIGGLLPEFHGTDILFLASLHIIYIYLPTFPFLVIALAAIAQPLVEICGMDLLGRRIADDVHMHSLRLTIPNIETDAQRLCVGTDALGDADGIGTALFHGLWQLEEKPVIVLTHQGVIGIHRLRLAPDVQGLQCTKGLVVARTNLPEACLLGLFHLEPFAKDEKCIVALGKGMTEIGTGTCSVVAVMHFTITELYHEVVLVNHFQSENLCCLYRNSHENQKTC